MKHSKVRTAVLTASTLVLTSGTALAVKAYISGSQFQPKSFAQMLQANQIAFPENADKSGKKQDEEEEGSSVWEKVDDAKEKEKPASTGGTGVLLQNGQQALAQGETGTVMTAAEAAAVGNGTSAGGSQQAAAGDAVYDFVSDPSHADLVIRMPGESSGSGNGSGDGTGAEGAASQEQGHGGSGRGSESTSSSSGSGGRGDSSSGSSSGNGGSLVPGKDNAGSIIEPIPDPEPGEDKPEKPGVLDPSIGSDPAAPGTKPKPSVGFDDHMPSFDESKKDDIAPGGVKIMKGFYPDYCLYRGQEITSRSVFYALDTFVVDKDRNTYAWGEDAYNKYIRIDGISFDGGKTWKSFPVTIPEDVDSGKVVIKASYRLSQSDSWTQTDVSYEVEDSRILVLSRRLESGETKIPDACILNTDSSNQYLTSDSRLNLYKLQNAILGNQGEIAELFPGWTENGELAPWLYPAGSGLHVLEPAETVPLDTNLYTVEIQPRILDDLPGESGFGSLGGFFQTLTNYDSWNGPEDLEIPQYVQAVDFSGLNPWNLIAVDTISVPDTVVYMNTASENYYVRNAWIVNEENPYYSSDADGILYSKSKDELLGIPTDKESITISGDTRKVLIPYYNNLKSICLEAESEEELPQMDCTHLDNMKCNVQMKDELLVPFLREEGKNFSAARGNTVSTRENPGITYHVTGAGAVLNEDGAAHCFVGGGTAAGLTPEIKSIQERAFQHTKEIQTIRLSYAGDLVELQKDSLAGSNIRRIVCYSQEQKRSIERQLDQAGADHDIAVELVQEQENPEGYRYFQEEVDGKLLTILEAAPAGITSFDSGALTDANGTKLVISSIAKGAFRGCTSLQWVTLSEDTKTIGASAFEGCSLLEGVLISSKDTITIGDKAFDDCSSLRFLASNARDCVRENDYVPVVEQSYGGGARQCFFFIPSYDDGDNYALHGYPERQAISFTMQSNVTSYAVVETGESGRVLYGLGQNGGREVPWLALRAGKSLDQKVQLPAETEEIYLYAFADTTAGGSYTVNWRELPELGFVDEGAFWSASLGGNVEITRMAYLGRNAFSGTQIERIELADVGNLGENVFADCGSLKEAVFDHAQENAALPSYSFQGCSNLERIVLKSAEPLLSFAHWYPNITYRINGDWTQEEEVDRVQLVVPEGAELKCIQEWQYYFTGHSNYEELRNAVEDDLFWELWAMPTNEEVLAECGKRLLEAENRIRGLLRMETVEQLTFPPEELQNLPAEQADDPSIESLEKDKDNEAVTESVTDPEEEDALTGGTDAEKAAGGNVVDAESGLESSEEDASTDGEAGNPEGDGNPADSASVSASSGGGTAAVAEPVETAGENGDAVEEGSAVSSEEERIEE